MVQVHLISYQNCFNNFLKLFLLLVLTLPIHPPYQNQCDLPKMHSGLNHYLMPFRWFPITEWYPSSLVQPGSAPPVSLLLRPCSPDLCTLLPLLFHLTWSPLQQLKNAAARCLESLPNFLHDPCDMCVPGPDNQAGLSWPCRCGIKKSPYFPYPTVPKAIRADVAGEGHIIGIKPEFFHDSSPY